MSLIKRLLPLRIKEALSIAIGWCDGYLIQICSRHRLLAGLYYFLFSGRFDQEHISVLRGRIRYVANKAGMDRSCYYLRRSVHRLEKGLVMRPRRPVFAEDYILDTVHTLTRVARRGGIHPDEAQWFVDVITEYFRVVQETAKVAIARAAFEREFPSVRAESRAHSIPYERGHLEPSCIDFDALNELFKRRRSVRWFLQDPVPLIFLRRAIDAASEAPSACNRQPFAFYVSASASKAVEIARCAGGSAGFVENLQCVVAVVGDLSAYPHEKDRHVIYIDSSLATMQFLLALETLGLSSCVINWPDIGSADERISGILNLKPYQRVIALVAVGYADPHGGVPFSQKKRSDILLRVVDS